MGKMTSKVTIFTDGSCSYTHGKSTGFGGWGSILMWMDQKLELSGGAKDTTNNRMEILAVIKALEALKEKCNIELYTDSQYVCNAINKGWAQKWKGNNWKRNKNEPALNSDLWEVLLNLLEKQNVKFNWVKGHAGHEENERCDVLARTEAQKFK